MDAAVNALLRDYEKAFDRLDAEGQASLFAETFISAGPKGTIAQSRDEFLTMARKAGDYYRSVGQTGAKILHMKETPISEAYTMVAVHWGVTFQKTGDKAIEFDVSYIIQTTGEQPKIIMFITHQDEDQAMKDLAA